jgi:hypothetical protein
MRSTPHLVFRAGDAAPVVRGWARPDTPDSARHQRPCRRHSRKQSAAAPSVVAAQNGVPKCQA